MKIYEAIVYSNSNSHMSLGHFLKKENAEKIISRFTNNSATILTTIAESIIKDWDDEIYFIHDKTIDDLVDESLKSKQY